MAQTEGGINYNKQWEMGHLHRLDELEQFDPGVGPALRAYSRVTSGDHASLYWQRALRYMENILFVAGRHYLDDMLFSKLVQSSDKVDLSVIKEVSRTLPKPTNDFLGRYVETNVALLTENRPIPRVTSRSDDKEDKDAAELSQMVIEYLWEAMGMPELHREIARTILICGTCWLEVIYDPSAVRRLAVPKMMPESQTVLPPGIPNPVPVKTPVQRMVPERDEFGRLVYDDKIAYGDLTATIVSPFEIHFPSVHRWNGEDMGWVMRETYASKDTLQDKFGPKPGLKLKKSDGWDMEAISAGNPEMIMDLPIWWWERVSQIVEGGGPNLYVGDPSLWHDFCVLRIFDRKPNALWPKGRTIITVGDKVLYDSPKKIGARAFDRRWPERWHPYIHFRWEALLGSPYGRALVTKLLPKIKRINSIDTSQIMWQRTVPIATWIIPRTSAVIDNSFAGGAGRMLEYDPRVTAGQKPEPVFPQPFPKELIEAREKMLSEMELIAGTEEILRGQRPVGVNNAAMLNILRKQALASRSGTLQYWDEGLELEGSIMLQETIKNINDDPLWAERLRILAREKQSYQTILTFSGSDLSDNVQVRVDTASMALVSREAKEAKAMDFLQYGLQLVANPNMPPELRNTLLEELGYDKALQPQGPDVDRAKMLISWIKQGSFQNLVPLPEDDPYIMYEFFVNELKRETFFDLSAQQQQIILKFIDIWRKQIEQREQQKMQMAMMMARVKGGGGQVPPQLGGGGAGQ